MTNQVVHRVFNPADNGAPSYVISENQVWLPGSYATEEAARQAFELSDAVLYELQEQVNNVHHGEARLITSADLATRSAV